MPKCCDKYTVRKYIKNKGYGHLLNKLLWNGFNPEDIPFDDLPQRFVIKVTHGSAFNIICTDKDKLDRSSVIRKCKRWLHTKFLPCYGEWFYGIERPRVIIEEFLEGDNGLPLFDYKFFASTARRSEGVKLIYVDTWKNGHHAINAYDENFNLFKGVELGYPNDDDTEVRPPECLHEMKEIATELSKDFLHVRVDLYYTHGKIIFGELTFTKGAGFGRIRSLEFDYKMGRRLVLPGKPLEYWFSFASRQMMVIFEAIFNEKLCVGKEDII